MGYRVYFEVFLIAVVVVQTIIILNKNKCIKNIKAKTSQSSQFQRVRSTPSILVQRFQIAIKFTKSRIFFGIKEYWFRRSYIYRILQTIFRDNTIYEEEQDTNYEHADSDKLYFQYQMDKGLGSTPREAASQKPYTFKAAFPKINNLQISNSLNASISLDGHCQAPAIENVGNQQDKWRVYAQDVFENNVFEKLKPIDFELNSSKSQDVQQSLKEAWIDKSVTQGWCIQHSKCQNTQCYQNQKSSQYETQQDLEQLSLSQSSSEQNFSLSKHTNSEYEPSQGLPEVYPQAQLQSNRSILIPERYTPEGQEQISDYEEFFNNMLKECGDHNMLPERLQNSEFDVAQQQNYSYPSLILDFNRSSCLLTLQNKSQLDYINNVAEQKHSIQQDVSQYWQYKNHQEGQSNNIQDQKFQQMQNSNIASQMYQVVQLQDQQAKSQTYSRKQEVCNKDLIQCKLQVEQNLHKQNTLQQKSDHIEDSSFKIEGLYDCCSNSIKGMKQNNGVNQQIKSQYTQSQSNNSDIDGSGNNKDVIMDYIDRATKDQKIQEDLVFQLQNHALSTNQFTQSNLSESRFVTSEMQQHKQDPLYSLYEAQQQNSINTSEQQLLEPMEQKVEQLAQEHNIKNYIKNKQQILQMQHNMVLGKQRSQQISFSYMSSKSCTSYGMKDNNSNSNNNCISNSNNNSNSSMYSKHLQDDFQSEKEQIQDLFLNHRKFKVEHFIKSKQLVLMDIIGKGGFKKVHRAKMFNIQKELAVKSQLIDQSDLKLKQMCIQELEIAYRLQHKNLVCFYGFDIVEKQTNNKFQQQEKQGTKQYKYSQVYIVEELCDIGNLSRGMQKNLFIDQPRQIINLKKICNVLLQIAEAIQYIHTNDVVHGDLKPENILLKTDKFEQPYQFLVKVTDFGLSVKLQNNQTHRSHLYGGTTNYQAPEIIEKGRLGKKADVFAFGVIMWEIFHNILRAQLDQEYKNLCEQAYQKWKGFQRLLDYERQSDQFKQQDFDGTQVWYQQNFCKKQCMCKSSHPTFLPLFPQFSLSTPAPYALLCNLCLITDPQSRVEFQEVLSILKALSNNVQNNQVSIGDHNIKYNKSLTLLKFKKEKALDIIDHQINWKQMVRSQEELESTLNH